MSDLQLFAPLPAAVEAALRASIRRFGVIVPVVTDQNGRIVDGHHRSRIADEEGVEYRVDVVHVTDDGEAREMARTLNADRRHLTEEQRREVVALLAGETVTVGREEVARHSPPAIAKALGVSLDTVQRDVEQLTDAGNLTRPAKTLGMDGKVYPTKRPVPEGEPSGDGEPAPEQGQGEKPKKRAASRKPLPDAFRAAAYDITKAVERIERLLDDDRYPRHADQVNALVRNDLIRVSGQLTNAINRMAPNQEEGSK